MEALLIICLVLIGLYGLWRWNTKATIIRVGESLPKSFPKDGFSHQSFELLLTRFVSEQGGVDYQAWKNDQQALLELDEYLAAVAKYSPESSPQRFNHYNDILVYWISAYNAQVIKSILSHWPLSSVTDLTAPVEVIKGLGFFYNRKFIFGGQAYSLYQVENDIIFGCERDPRVHFILNCGSGGCPIIRPQLPLGDKLESFLAKAAVEFVANPKHLKINHDEKKIYLSMIFKWYRNTFIGAMNRRSIKPRLRDYLQLISGELLSLELQRAYHYDLEFMEYDWAVNNVKQEEK